MEEYAISRDAPRRRAIVYGGVHASNETWALYFDEATTAILVSLIQSDVSQDRIRLEWLVDGALGASFTAYRRADGEDWRPIASLLPDGSGHLVLEDRDVHPGGRYDYRLGVVVDGSQHYYGDVSIVVPLQSALQLDGARPNPGPGPLVLSFGLPSDAPATLELVDLTGRRVVVREVGSLGRGQHVLRIGEPGSLRAGLYFARLTQAGSARTAKVVIAR